MKMIQIRNVPDEIHATLKSRAALDGLSLSDYLLREMKRISERPTPMELRARRAHERNSSTSDAVGSAGIAPTRVQVRAPTLFA
jgi:antitoxin FitA